MLGFFMILFTLTFANISNSFGVCSAGYYAGQKVTLPSGYYFGNANTYGYKPQDGSTGYYYENGSFMGSVSGLGNGEWYITGSYNGVSGTARGTSFCSTWRGSLTDKNPGVNCWCLLTSWTPTNGTIQDICSKTFFGYYDSQNDCQKYCAGLCIERYEQSERGKLFSNAKISIPCPDGGTTAPFGAEQITGCYISRYTNLTDTTGTYNFTTNCYYTE